MATRSTRAAGAGYSGTPLAKKLGIGEGARVCTTHAPRDYRALLEPLPPGVRFTTRMSRDVRVAHLFTRRRAELRRWLVTMRRALAPEAALWVSWPKRSSGMETEVTADAIRELALPLGLVDVKVCAVDETWSGLKLVIRKALRAG